MSFQSLSFKVALIGSMVVAVIVGLGTLILVTKVSAVVDAQTDALEHKTIANEADLVRERLNMAAASADALASTFEMLQASGIKERSVYDAVLRAVAERNPDFLGTWAGWEPNALDGRDAEFAGKAGYDATGRFLSYWNRAAGAVRRDVLTAYETDPYYLAPQKLNRAVAVEPYFYPVAGENHLIMSLGMPLKSNGVTVGTIGIDVDLTRLYGSLANFKPFGTGHLAIVSAGGMTVVHPAPESAGKPLDTIDARAAEVSRQAIETKATARLDAAGPDGQIYHYVAEPVQAGNSQETWAAVAAIPLATLNAASEQVKWTMTVVAFVSVGVVGALLFTLLSTLLGRPLRALGRTVDAMAAGDYDRSVQQAGRRDEIGTISQAIERFREALKTRAAQDADREARLRAERAAEGRNLMMRLADQFEVEVGSVVDLVSSSASRLHETAQTLTSVADNSTSQSGVVKEAALEASLNVAKIAASADELGASVEEIGRKVAGSATLSREAADEASASAVVIDELSRAASEIGDIVKVIAAIARQTNLLALNAAIEASRAGETGQGFAVVASEVKTLATNTANATDAINQKISAIQASAGRAVETSHAINNRIHAINATTTSVAGMIEQQGVATLDIVEAVRQASIGTGDVTGSIKTVATAAQETGDEAEKVLTAASDLTSQSAQLRGVVNAFLASVRTA